MIWIWTREYLLLCSFNILQNYLNSCRWSFPESVLVVRFDALLMVESQWEVPDCIHRSEKRMIMMEPITNPLSYSLSYTHALFLMHTHRYANIADISRASTFTRKPSTEGFAFNMDSFENNEQPSSPGFQMAAVPPGRKVYVVLCLLYTAFFLLMIGSILSYSVSDVFTIRSYHKLTSSKVEVKFESSIWVW